ncbi:MAG: hypothetical protein IT434_16305 [Phycisphaerales bacterium]|nr:hypothetical protein [Phycisphaerales bacterium]
MDHDLAGILVDEREIAKRVRELGAQLAADLERDLARESGSDGTAGDAANSDDFGKVVMIPVMTGAIVFVADLIRAMPMRLSLKLVAVSSYPGASVQSKGAKLAAEIPGDLAGKHVVVVDDILDSGQTLGLVRELIAAQKPASLRVCVLLRKPDRVRQRAVDVQYVGFEIPDEFVVGYGLDFDGHYRNVPNIATLRPEVVERVRRRASRA